MSETVELPTARFIDAKHVGTMFGFSPRHVMRLADGGKFPWGVKFGLLRRWDLRELEAFIAGGCKALPKGGRL